MTAATNLKFEKSSSALENILNQQRSQYDKAGIGYSTKQEHTVEKNEFRSPKKKNDGNLQIVANNLRNFNEENSKDYFSKDYLLVIAILVTILATRQ